MFEIPIEELVDKTGSVFKLVNLAARRTMELNDGYKPKVEDVSAKKTAIIALHEIASGKIQYNSGK